MTGDRVPTAVLRFRPGWQQVKEGAIARGGRLTIDYDPSRLTGCRRRDREAEIWKIEGCVRFHPGGATFRGNLLEDVRSSPHGGPVVSHKPVPFEVVVPNDATRVEVWFHSYIGAEARGGRCDAWDSRFGQNYWFDIEGDGPP